MTIDPETYGSEIAPGAGCGPDLYDTEPAFAALMDSCEEMLPERFSDFDRTEIDFRDIFTQMEGFLKQSRDLRLLTQLAQFGLLGGQLHVFANALRVMRKLLENHWDDVHPQDADFGYMERMGALEALNNRPTVALPLESTPLIKTRRTGPISYRAIQIASGETPPRPDEPTVSLGAIEAALTSGEIEQAEIDEVLQDLADLPAELEAITAVSTSRLRESDAKATPPNYENLCTLLRDINRELSARLGLQTQEDVQDEAEEASGEQGEQKTSPEQSPPVGAIKNAAEAQLLLETVENYFMTRETSHPALFLVREARGLIGKSYLDALRTLMPSRFDDVALLLGTSGLQLTNDRLVELNEAGSGDLGETDDFEVPLIASRSEAMRHVGSVKTYFATNEPTSPIPLLLEEAQSMSAGSFTGLLGQFLRPEEE